MATALILVSILAVMEAAAFLLVVMRHETLDDRVLNLHAGLEGPWKCEADKRYAEWLLEQDKEVMAA